MINKIPSKKKLIFVSLFVFLLIFFTVLIPAFIVMVDAGEVGVVSTFGKVSDSELHSGIAIKNPFSKVTKMDIRTREYTMSSVANEGAVIGDDSIDARTNDGASIFIDITVLYHLDPEKASEIYKNIGLDYETKIIRPSIRSVIRQEASNYTIIEAYSTKRDDLTKGIAESLTNDFSQRGVVLEDVLVRKINISQTLSDSIEQKLAAQQEAEKFDFILQKETKEAARKRIEAEGQRDAQSIINQSLTANYLYYLYIQNLKDSKSTIYVPINPENGMPLFKQVE